jgi:hypothetical protein
MGKFCAIVVTVISTQTMGSSFDLTQKLALLVMRDTPSWADSISNIYR